MHLSVSTCPMCWSTDRITWIVNVFMTVTVVAWAMDNFRPFDLTLLNIFRITASGSGSGTDLSI